MSLTALNSLSPSLQRTQGELFRAQKKSLCRVKGKTVKNRSDLELSNKDLIAKVNQKKALALPLLPEGLQWPCWFLSSDFCSKTGAGGFIGYLNHHWSGLITAGAALTGAQYQASYPRDNESLVKLGKKCSFTRGDVIASPLACMKLVIDSHSDLLATVAQRIAHKKEVQAAKPKSEPRARNLHSGQYQVMRASVHLG
jgi:hypothetical protein